MYQNVNGINLRGLLSLLLFFVIVLDAQCLLHRECLVGCT